MFTWDVHIVINYIKSEWGYSEGLLMALISASRASAIHHLDIRYMVKGNGKYVSKFHRLHKSWLCGKPIPSLELHEYSEDKSLYVVTTIDEYIKRTVNWGEGAKTHLLLGYIKPDVAVSNSTDSRQIKETLKFFGIDVAIFKEHSTRPALS